MPHGDGALVVINCGRVVTGDINAPLADADAILVANGRIAAVGMRSDLQVPRGAKVIDANGLDAMPGLIDCHVHLVLGDWSPRLQSLNWIAAYGQAGVTTVISQGSFPLDGYPDDRLGMVSLGIVLARAFKDFRPGGVRVHGAAISLVRGLVEDDFRQLADEGVFLIAEIGMKSLVDPHEVRTMLEMAHRHGFISRLHFGPQAVPGSHEITAAAAAEMGAHIASHANGGPTGPAVAELDYMLEQTRYTLELTHTGNEAALLHLAGRARAMKALDRLVIGSNTPTGAGIQPRAIWRTVNLLAAVVGVPPAEAIAIATGNGAHAYGVNGGLLAPDRDADILLVDAPAGSQGSGALEAITAGDVPAIGALIVGGKVLSWDTTMTMPAQRHPRMLSDA